MSNDSISPLITPPSHPIVLPNLLSSATLVYLCYDGKDIDKKLLNRCAKLFGENYGIWGNNPSAVKGPKPGSQVKMSGRRLGQQCVAVPDSTILTVCYQTDPQAQDLNELELLGHAFATVWGFEGGHIGWVMQLVVSLSACKRYIVTSLLQMLKTSALFHSITAIGLVSSHPSACHVLSKYTDVSIRSVDMKFCQTNAKAILDVSPVEYVKNMELQGTLFEDNCTTGAVSCVFSNFYVDHTEPLEALAAYKDTGKWLLGKLLEGHEYLIILPAKSSIVTPADPFV